MAIHHIIPFHEWKTRINSNATRYNREFNSSDNIIELTTEQHAQAHQLLYELFNKFEDFLAWKMILGQIGKDEAQKLIARRNGKNNKGRKHSTESKRKMSKSHTGIKKSESYISWFKENNPMNNPASRTKVGRSKIGKPRDANTRMKLSLSHLKYEWEIETPDGTIIITNNLTQYCKDHSLHQGNMSRVAKGELLHLKGYKCKKTHK